MSSIFWHNGIICWIIKQRRLWQKTHLYWFLLFALVLKTLGKPKPILYTVFNRHLIEDTFVVQQICESGKRRQSEAPHVTLQWFDTVFILFTNERPLIQTPLVSSRFRVFNVHRYTLKCKFSPQKITSRQTHLILYSICLFYYKWNH